MMRVQLGFPDKALDPESLSAGIRRVQFDADFSQLPSSPTWGDISDLALQIDGYTVAGTLPDVNGLFEWFNPIWNAHLEDGGPLPSDSLRLWLMLFACQRGYLRDIWGAENPDGSPSNLAIAIRNLYQQFRHTVQQEQQTPAPDTPTYVPRRPRPDHPS